MLGISSLIAILAWRVYGATPTPNLLTNPNFEKVLDGWQVAAAGDGQATSGPAPGDAGNTVARLTIPDAASGSWVGLGQKLALQPLQRYRLVAHYRVADRTQNGATLIWRVSQFDQAGRLVKSDETSISTRVSSPQDGQERAAWNVFGSTFVTDEQASTIEIGLGLLGAQAATVEIDDLTLAVQPTWLGALRDDPVALIAACLVLVVGGYGLGRLVGPGRRRLAANTGLAVASLGVTLLAAEIAVRFVPVSLISPDWPAGYHIPYLAGKSYRLAYNYPTSFVTDDNGDRHLVMSSSLGVRDIEITPAVGQDVVLVLGDSMTFGWAIDDIRDTWPRRLDGETAQILDEPDRYHLVNAGVSGYNTFQEVMLMETLIKDMEQAGVKPRVALISFFSRIWERNLYGPRGRFTMLNGVIMYDAVKQALLHLPGRLVEESRFDELKVIGASRLNAGHQFLIFRSRLYFILSLMLVNRLDENWDAIPKGDIDPVAINYEAFRAFKKLAEANGIQPAVAYLPADNLFTSYKAAENEALVTQLAAICRELDIPFINPYDNMRKLGITGDNAKEKLTLVYNRHYSAAGNALYARALAPLFIDYLIGLDRTAQSSLQPE